MANLDFFLELETRVWQALVDADAAADKALLAADFLGAYSTGFCDRAGHVAQLSGAPSVARFSLSAARLLGLGPSRYLLAYRADFVRYGRSECDLCEAEAMYVSSIWEERGAGWLNIFSQDSSTSDAAPV